MDINVNILKINDNTKQMQGHTKGKKCKHNANQHEDKTTGMKTKYMGNQMYGEANEYNNECKET